MPVLEILLSNGANCNALYRDRFEKIFPAAIWLSFLTLVEVLNTLWLRSLLREHDWKIDYWNTW